MAKADKSTTSTNPPANRAVCIRLSSSFRWSLPQRGLGALFLGGRGYVRGLAQALILPWHLSQVFKCSPTNSAVSGLTMFSTYRGSRSRTMLHSCSMFRSPPIVV